MKRKTIAAVDASPIALRYIVDAIADRSTPIWYILLFVCLLWSGFSQHMGDPICIQLDRLTKACTQVHWMQCSE
jgi:hypothetical protein